MPAVPSSTDSITDLPPLLVWADSYNMTDDFVTWNPRATTYQYGYRARQQQVLQWSSKYCLLYDQLRVTNTTSLDLDENLAFFRLLGLDLLNDNGPALLLEHSRLMGLGDLRSHAD